MKTAGFSIFGLIFAIAAVVYGLLAASLPSQDGEIRLSGLSAEATVRSDDLAIPTIAARNRDDAFRVLGFLHARDRLFQMELMRRKSAGRLAELFGDSALALDRKQRVFGFERVAGQIFADMPETQRSALQAYAAGVNAYLTRTTILAPEFLALRLRPEPWRPEDSLLVVLAMFQTLNGYEQDERMASVMAKALPADLLTFLTPDTDPYATVLTGGDRPRRYSPNLPRDALAALPEAGRQLAVNRVDAENVVAGSNNWVVAGAKTADGRAIVANDMHLALGVPNIWYRAELQYRDQRVYGVTLPGVPGVIVGGNDHVAWGFTNVTADLFDLVSLDTDVEHPGAYRTPQGWQRFASRRETIKVKGQADVEIDLRDTIWGPVSDQPLLGKPVAIKWTALERYGVDLGLLDLDGAANVDHALTLINQAAGPPQNVVVADRDGRIGWTYMGRFPKRSGFDGLISRSWADGDIGWQGFIPPEQLPRLVDPAEGFIATANNRTLGADYPYVIGHNWALGYRAFRIVELLREKDRIDESAMLAIQLDSRAGALDFYRQLALDELRNLSDKDGDLQSAERALQAWDGRMNAISVGAAVVNEFRKRLAETVFAKIVAACRVYDPEFRYAWRAMETPLRQLLTERPPGLLAESYRDDWSAMIADTLRDTVRALRQQYPRTEPDRLTWGEVHAIGLQHPFTKAMPQLAAVLNLPLFASDGCASVCVRVMDNAHGASERLVLSPAHPEDAILQMPGGQSGHFLSAHYRDQQAFWQNGQPAAMFGPARPGVLEVLPE
ncbi:penicillin acylase family protein [Methylococcaceae bacterium WWC4]|nr:penicillin acylase family protein [Methylococcaceae bacterium WWC4]